MFKNNIYTMVSSLALLGVLRALKIDSQLAVIKNDCYERLAIGQRHNSKDIYKTSHASTVFECQLLCTEEKEHCKSFSFGIGVKGNASCELSGNTIKETADLKPIGTNADTDFDLYIKKLGCTLVIDKNNPAFNHYKPQDKPVNNVGYGTPAPYDKPQSVSYGPPPDGSYSKPSIKPDSGYGLSSTIKPSYNKPQEEVQHVQTLVSISTGPQKPLLHPYHDILVDSNTYNNARPPFRPPALNHPYDKPEVDGYGFGSLINYKRPMIDRYDTRPEENRPIGYGHRPIPDRYGSYIPRPDHYNDYYKPQSSDYYKPKPYDDYYKPRPIEDKYNFKPRPGDEYNTRPRPPTDEYNPRPVRPPVDEYNQRPIRPPVDEYNQRPIRPPVDEYNSRPMKPPIDEYNPRPIKPPIDEYNPRPLRPPIDEYNPRPMRPPIDEYNPIPIKPSIDEYNQRPIRPPVDEYNPKPIRPPIDEYNPRPVRPPIDEYNPRPMRPPIDEYNPRPIRPPIDEYNPRPIKPPVDEYNPKPKPPSSNEYNSKPKPSAGEYNPKPIRPPIDEYNPRPKPPTNEYNQNPPSDSYKKDKPINEYLFNGEAGKYDQLPEENSKLPPRYEQIPSIKPPSTNRPNSVYDNTLKVNSESKDNHKKPIVTQSVGPHGESITSIITEIETTCFRRVLAGKRVTRALVKRALYCERVEDCQRECAEEKRFACEGFNYRLDPTGRGKGECELLEIPLSHLDIGRDLYPDPDYDYYERDRNAASVNCKPRGYGGYDGYNRRYDQQPYDWWSDDRRYGTRRPRPDYGFDSRPQYGYDGYKPNGNRRGDFAYHDSHHSDYSHNHHYEHYDHGPPPPPPPYDYKPYEPYLHPNRRPIYDEDRYYHKYNNREKDKPYWGYTQPSWGNYGSSYGTNYNPNEFERRNYYLPPPAGGNKYWGQYGGSYGNGGLNLQYSGYGHSQSFDFWGLNKYEEKFHNYRELPPKRTGGGSYLPEIPYKPPHSNGGGSYLPEIPQKPTSIGGGGSYLPEPPPKPPVNNGGHYLPELSPPKPINGGSYLPGPTLQPPYAQNGGSYVPEPPYKPPVNTGNYLPSAGKPDQNDIYPPEPRYPYYYDYLQDECSLRTAAGFRLHKGIVKKFLSVPNIYKCEVLCFKEKDFPCASYAFRYSPLPNSPPENCYLSNRNYKELDFYTDLEPDRNFDVYTMNNMKRCEQPYIPRKDKSECFWRVRSGQRLDHKIVRDSLSVKSIVECEIECIRCKRFTCRAFSFRYGPAIGDNCLLTDWPYYEMDPRVHFYQEPGFEIYERGSFGHGCEPHHFGIRGKPWKNPGTTINQLCYVSYRSPAVLLKQATKKEIQVKTEEECKAECSKLRQNTLFQCMSLSFSTKSTKWEANCKLSDILQRDLLPNVDYVSDPDSWMFAWDNYNPECKAIAGESIHNHLNHKEDRIDDTYNALGTWRVYSVSGWPCRRGTLCRENRAAGFWFCELEGGDENTWDYCCRPDHQCGFSEGFEYQWCYVGPGRTQWRKCSDRYYPYIHNLIDRFDRPPQTSVQQWPGGGNYLNDFRPHSYRPGIRPDRPPAPATPPPPRPSLDEYEQEFNSQFLDPPRPGGFGQPRHWPLSYLHKEMPSNNTDSDSRLMKAAKKDGINPKYAAIQNLIDIIKSNDLKNIQYQITNESNKADDILFVKIPLPMNFTQETRKREKIVADNETKVISDPIDLNNETKNNSKRSQKSFMPLHERPTPLYRRSYITRTNATNFRTRNSRNL